MSVINDVSRLEWNYTILLRTSYTTSSPHKSVQRRQNVSHRFTLSGRRQWVYAHPTVLSSFLQWQIGLLSLVLKLHLKNHSYGVGTTTHLDTFDTDYDLTACATCSCATDGFCITLTTLLQLHCHTLHVH